MLSYLADHLAPWVLLALLVVALAVLGLVLWAARRGADSEPPASRPVPPRVNLEGVRHSFRQAVGLIESNLSSHAERYKTSWTLVLNTAETGEVLPLAAAGIPRALASDDTLSAQAHGLHWHFFDKGVVIQVQGQGADAPDAADAPGAAAWDQLLGLCRKYRPERPFDAIVVAVPAAALLTDDPQARADIAARAKDVHRRLWLAQNRFAMQFPVYLVISGCEVVPGFTAFGRALPDNLRRSMLGWSSPFELSAPFQSAWIDAGMDAVTRDAQDACAELCALAVAGGDSADYFLLPTHLADLRAGTRLFMEELMRPSAYHEPFLFRGFYLTGDCSEAQALRTSSRALPAVRPALSGGPEGDPTEAAPEAAPQISTVPAPSQPATSTPPSAFSPERLAPEPAFLRDVFERKIFAEPGLVRASRTQHLPRPLVSRVLRWTAVAVPAVWALGLAAYTVRLSNLAPQVVTVLQELAHQGRATGEPMDIERDRARVLGTLALMERMEGGQLGALLMPGSWTVFDDLQLKLRNRLERGFIDNAIEPLRMGAYARISELTGVPTDPATGTLIVGSACTLPAGWQDQVQAARRSGLNVEDLPEFTAMLEFTARLEELDRGVRAMERLSYAQVAASGEDLRVAVRVFLGAEVGAKLDRAAELLRKQSLRLVPLALGPMQQASVCAFEAGMKSLHARMFDRNELLLSEQGLDALARSLAGAGGSVDRSRLQKGWQTVLDTLARQDALMVGGKGAWMRHPELSLGPAHEGLMQRMQALALVGAPAVDAAQQQTQQASARFWAQWSLLLNPQAEHLLGVGLLWLEKEARWSHTPERTALREALAHLLSQPFMKAVPRALPEPASGQAVAWDAARLDQALVLADTRRKLEAEALPKIPPAVREDVHALMRGALADAVVDLLAQSVMFMPAAAAPAVGEADRLRLARAGSALSDLGARAAVVRLGQVLARDAMVRLRRLDDALAQGDFYRPRDLDFRSWTGDKSPMPAAFGAGDAAGLAVYAATQQAFIDALAREAEALLPALEGSGGSLMVQRWRGITGDMARYRLKSAASSLSQLEQFVVATAADVDLLNCADRIRPMPRRVGDFFSDQLVALQSALATRCQDLRRTETRDAWSRFAEAFNRDLAGRAPFRAASGTSPERPPADVEEGAAVLQNFERVQRLLGARAVASEPIRRFAEQMERVRVFMAPLYPTTPEAAPGYDVYAEFRANPAQEHQGNKIIEWSLTVGTQTLRAREPVRPLRWEPGLPIEVRLRLARDGPVAPQAEAGQPAMSVEEPREVRYRFSDPWALYSLIASQREPESASRTEARSQLLRFEFPLVATGVVGLAQTQEMRARVYLRLAVSPAGKRAPLAWPGAFPVRAPDWSTP